MKEHVDQLTGHIQERCLWQFFSRSWDREENIEGILTKAAEILCEEKSVIETNTDKTFYADAKILVADFKRLYPWIAKMDKKNIKLLLQGVKDRMKFITVSGSHNEELNDPNY